MSERAESAPAPARRRRGGVKFVLIHHGACADGGFHYRIASDGTIQAELDETERGQHPRSIAVAVDGNFDDADPGPEQTDALKKLLLELKLRYPSVEIGAHRQVRGSTGTTCPGRRFPMRALGEWSRTELLERREEVLTREFEEQYSKI